MAVSAFVPLSQVPGYDDLYEARASVTGDLSGGAATVAIVFPQLVQWVWELVRIYYQGRPNVNNSQLTITGQFRTATGGTASILLVAPTDSSGAYSLATSKDILQAVPLIKWLEGDIAANQPNIQMVDNNADGTLYVLQLTARRRVRPRLAQKETVLQGITRRASELGFTPPPEVVGEERLFDNLPLGEVFIIRRRRP